MAKINGAQMVLKSLEAEGVDTIFGLPGGTVIPLYDAIYDSKINHVLMRHEQAAAHAADGYARVSGKPGVCIATSGPGATNLVTGIATANLDSVPMVAITGQVPTTAIGTDAFQEADTLGITIPIVKHSMQVRTPEQIGPAIKKAFYIASTGRHGPVLVDIPADIQKSFGNFEYPKKISFLGYHPEKGTDLTQLDEAVKLLENAERPLIFAGGGVIKSGAAAKLTELAEKLQIPVATSLLGKGAFPESHPLGLSLGMAGMHGHPVANRAIMTADVILAIGSRFSDRTTGKISSFASGAKIIHIDLDAAEIDKVIGSEVWLVGDAGTVVDALTTSINRKYCDRCHWLEELELIRQREPLPRTEYPGQIAPWQIIETLREITGGKSVLTTEVGQHQMWAAMHYKVEEPGRFVTSGGLGTMGFGFPAAIGASYACPGEHVCCIAGDGSFMMNIQELDTCARYNIPVKVFILNNSCLGMVRQWQEFFYEKRYSNTLYSRNPDFVKIAEGMGVSGFLATKPEEVRKTIEAALSVPGPAVVDFRIPQEALVLPMVTPGSPIDKMILY
ncbi:MAG: biosynthetic-type acetolactate synthase large subunit [Synergistaceae bacterium]|nr:biosynthetic-type acetolactate synthase large subunit [Synergistaceae bacterium]